MRRAAILALACALAACAPAGAPQLGAERWAVANLAGEEFLKLRAGPGLGFAVVAGLPAGTELRGGDCQLIGGTSWCEVALAVAPGLVGYVAQAYLAPL